MFIRQDLVDQHAEAYRYRGSPYAEALIAGEDANLTYDERVAVWRAAAVEIAAELEFIEAARRISSGDVE